MKPPTKIYLNINDEDEMPPLDEIAWDEVTWSAEEPATRQAIEYVLPNAERSREASA